MSQQEDLRKPDAHSESVESPRQKYRKRPVVITAQQFLEGELIPKGICFGGQCGNYDSGAPHVHTIHENQRVDVVFGDWIIPEPDGQHYYPCKADIFWRTYEHTTESAPASSASPKETGQIEQWRNIETDPPVLTELTVAIRGKPYVLAVDAKGRMSVGYPYRHSTGEVGWVFAKPIGEPTHWMPLPEAPSMEQEGNEVR